MKALIFIIVLTYPMAYVLSLIVHMLSRRPIGPLVCNESIRPSVTLIIASAGEGTSAIHQKLQNTYDLDYPRESLEVILFSDGRPFPVSLDHAAWSRVRFLQFEQLGKTECQNRAVASTMGEVVIFTDVTAMLERDAVARIVRWYADPRVGSVGGNFAYRFSGANVEAGYVSREIRNKKEQGRYGIITGYFGPFYSVRRSAYPVMPVFYPSDYMLPLLVSQSGLWSILDVEACSYRVLDRSMEQEITRKRRIVAQGIASSLHFLVGKGKRRLDLITAVLNRKFFRWLSVPYGVLAYLALFLHPPLFLAVTACGAGMLLLSLLYRLAGGRNTVLLAPYYLLVIGTATMLAFFDILRGELYATWDPGSR